MHLTDSATRTPDHGDLIPDIPEEYALLRMITYICTNYTNLEISPFYQELKAVENETS